MAFHFLVACADRWPWNLTLAVLFLKYSPIQAKSFPLYSGIPPCLVVVVYSGTGVYSSLGLMTVVLF